MKVLNFYPYYEPYIKARNKTTTIRLHKPDFVPGEVVSITLGWSDTDNVTVSTAKIGAVYSVVLGDLGADDFRGESPDCLSPEPTALVISAIYKQVVTLQTRVWVVKFMYV